MRANRAPGVRKVGQGCISAGNETQKTPKRGHGAPRSPAPCEHCATQAGSDSSSHKAGLLRKKEKPLPRNNSSVPAKLGRSNPRCLCFPGAPHCGATFGAGPSSPCSSGVFPSTSRPMPRQTPLRRATKTQPHTDHSTQTLGEGRPWVKKKRGGKKKDKKKKKSKVEPQCL